MFFPLITAITAYFAMQFQLLKKFAYTINLLLLFVFFAFYLFAFIFIL